MELRSRLLSAQGCSFRAEITADYGDTLQTFSLDCRADAEGDLSFAVVQPEEIAGITGTITEAGGALTFEDTALSFPLMADDQLTPVTAPWILVKTLRGGCITSACQEEELLHLTIDDSYEDDALQLDIWLQEEQTPLRADILYDGKRILSLGISAFHFL